MWLDHHHTLLVDIMAIQNTFSFQLLLLCKSIIKHCPQKGVLFLIMFHNLEYYIVSLQRPLALKFDISKYIQNIKRERANGMHNTFVSPLKTMWHVGNILRVLKFPLEIKIKWAWRHNRNIVECVLTIHNTNTSNNNENYFIFWYE